jgi:hypothetical protein
MNRLCTASVIAAVVLSAPIARAAPPTVVPSPGYDARLEEQRKAASASASGSTVIQPAPVTPTTRHHGKRTH